MLPSMYHPLHASSSQVALQLERLAWGSEFHHTPRVQSLDLK